jgi:hypothetical protein
MLKLAVTGSLSAAKAVLPKKAKAVTLANR